jgi:5'(3')-deoxyribonucleotidase
VKPLVLLDCDGVLSDFVGIYLDILRTQCGIDRRREDVTEFDIGKSLGLTAEQASDAKRRIGDFASLARMLGIYPGAQDGVRALREVADIHVVTSPWNSNRTWCSDREAWLYEHFGIKSADVTHTAAKHLVRGDFLVDDKTSTLHKWAAAHPSGVAVQWATPHNRLDGWTGASTCDWARLVEMVRSAEHCECTGLAFGHAPHCPARVQS